MPLQEAPAFTVFGEAGQRLRSNIATIMEEFRRTPTFEAIHPLLDGVHNASTLLPWPEPSNANAMTRKGVRDDVTILLRDLGTLRRSLEPLESTRLTGVIDDVKDRLLHYQPPLPPRS